MKKLSAIFLLAALAACADGAPRDYESNATCGARGLQTGTAEFDHCVREETAGRRLDEQRQEFDARKADEDYWRNHRGMY